MSDITSTEEICTCPVCGRLHRYLANNPPPVISGEAVIIPRAQHEALMVAAKLFLRGYPADADDYIVPDCDCYNCKCERVAVALRAGGILEGE